MLGLAFSLLLSLSAPTGSHVDVFAKDLDGASALLALDDGTVLVSRPAMNDVIALRDRDGDGRADEMRTAVSRVVRAHGLAMRGRTLYVAGVKRIVAAERLPDGSFGAPREIVADLPDGGLHPNRAIGFGPDGKLYVAVGSACADCPETNPEHATLLQLDPDGTNRRIFARGLPSTLGFGWHPTTGELWAAGAPGQLERLGDGLDRAGASDAPFVMNGENAFVAWRGKGTIARVRFADGKPAGAEDLVSGIDGRVAGMTITRDGTLLFADGKSVYRVASGPALPPPMTSSSAEETSMPILSRALRVEKLGGPESVIHDEEQDVYFVSNDGGFISRVSPAGKIVDREFIGGLKAPKGMAIRGVELWVADVDKVRAFDRVTGAELKTIDLAPHGAVRLSGLAVGGDDALYVTDSDVRVSAQGGRTRQGDGRIYRVWGDKVELATTGEELRSPSGIAWDGMRFLVAQSYGQEVLAWQPGSQARAVLRGPGAYGGIVVLPNGTVIVSSGYDGGLHVAAGGVLEPLFAPRPPAAGIGFDRKRNRLLVPSPSGDSLEIWNLPPMSPGEAISPRNKHMTSGLRTAPPPVLSAAGSPGTSSTTR